MKIGKKYWKGSHNNSCYPIHMLALYWMNWIQLWLVDQFISFNILKRKKKPLNFQFSMATNVTIPTCTTMVVNNTEIVDIEIILGHGM
jgi:hypothetical protein